MVIGLDYHNTITRNEDLFSMLMTGWRDMGQQVYIISALKEGADPSKIYEREDCLVPHDGIEIVYFNNYDEIPELKLEACCRLGIDILFDDMPAVTALCSANGILTCLVR